MIDLSLDPGMIAFVPDAPFDDLLARVQRLVEWTTFLRENSWVKIHMPPSANRRLREEGFLPSHDPVKRALETTGLRYVYSPEDVIRPIYNLLQLCVEAHHCCVVDEMHDGFESAPTQPWVREDVDSITENTLLLGLIERELHQDNRLDKLLSLLASPRIEFQAEVQLVDPSNVVGFSALELPRGVQGQVRLVGTVEHLLSLIGSEQVWRAASGNADIKLAIRLRCRERLSSTGEYAGLDKIPEFYVGPDFFASLAGREGSGNGKYAVHTLDCCAAAVLNLPTIELKEFKKNPRAADNATPLRGHISKSKAAMRLMVWQRPAKGSKPAALEFANVGTKWEEEISYSDPDHAV